MKKYKLGDLLSEFHAGKAIQTENIKNKGAYPVYGGNGQRGYTDSYNQDGEYLIIGRQGAYCGNVRYNIGKAYLTEHAIVGQTREYHNSIYIALKLSLMKLSQLQGQSAQPGLSVNTLSCISMEMPPKEIQDKIADIMLKLDRKIELNRQINDNLEAMAKQLYDYWFVQFDFPNEDGKPYKSSGGAMVWNEKLKREIPQGWDFCFLEDLLTIRNGRDHKHLADGIYPVYGSGGEMRKVSEYLYDGESVLMPRKGSLNNIMYVNEAFWTVDTMFYSEMKLSNCAKYIYYTLKDIDFTRWDSGTGVPSMTSSTLYSIKLVKPQNETLKKFDEMISPLFEHMKQISEQNVVLTKQRDELLPLLMNGQASVNSD